MSDPNGASNGAAAGPSAPNHPLSSTSFHSIEYPGYVSSFPAALPSLGGDLKQVQHAFEGDNKLLELRLRPYNPFAHPVAGEVVGTANVVLKIMRRRRRRRNAYAMEVDGAAGKAPAEKGEFKAEIVGGIQKTARFRAMADFQYDADLSDPIPQLRQALETSDLKGTIAAMKDYKLPPPQEEMLNLAERAAIVSKARAEGNDLGRDANPALHDLRMIPPPIFSRMTIHQNYAYRQNPASVETTALRPDTGESYQRMINKHRAKGWNPVPCAFDAESVPEEPTSEVKEGAATFSDRLVALVREKFEERPVWTRTALMNQFDPADAKAINNGKPIVSVNAFTFTNGPWSDCLVRYGYDPRLDPKARFYQRVYFRNVNAGHQRKSLARMLSRKSTGAGEQGTPDDGASGEDASKSDRKSHIFDGENLHRAIGNYQLIDVTDPLLHRLIHDTTDLREECHEKDGFFPPVRFRLIRELLRRKFRVLYDEGRALTDEECQEMIAAAAAMDDDEAASDGEIERKLAIARVAAPTDSRHRHRSNRAKVPLAPEEAAAARLKAALVEERRAGRSARARESTAGA